MADLIIKISAETKNFEDAVKNIEDQTEALEGRLTSVAKVSGVAFGGLVASAGLALKAFAAQEQATLQLTTSLQNQGIASSTLVSRYRDLATAVQNKTGIDDDAIVKGQAVLQGFLGQQEVTEDLTFALADLSERTGSVETAADLLGKAINGQTKSLRLYGIQIDDNLTKQERVAAITEEVNKKFGGLATAANQGLGGVRGLKNAFGDFLENIGQRLAPTVSQVIASLTTFFTRLNENQPLIDFIVETGKIAAIVTGIVTALATGGLALIQISKAFAIARAAVTAFGLASKVAVGATGLGLLLIVAAEIHANWNKIFPVLQAVYTTFVNNITKLTGALGKLLAGAFTFDLGTVKAGLAELQGVVLEGFENIKKAAPPGSASLHAAITSTPEQIAAAEAERAKAEEEQALALERLRIFNQEALAESELFTEFTLQEKERFNEESKKKLVDSVQTEKTIRQQALNDELKQRIDANNRFLMEQQRFGTTFATINSVLNDERVKGARSATAELVQLQTSENSTLRSIGKAAAVAQITFKTAESAMNIYAGFSTIPIIGPVLGVAGAAAAVAFGAEQIGKVLSAQEGGIVPGVSRGVDSVPAMLEPGEFVVPRANFSEVVNAVARQQTAQSAEATSGVTTQAEAAAQNVGVEIMFSGDSAEQFLTARQVEARSLGTLREASSS